MRLSTAARVLAVAIGIAGVTAPPTKATACPQGRSALSGNDERSADGRQTEYKNIQYGFCFLLPKSWQGFSIVVNHWQGFPIGEGGNVQAQQGPIISIRDPRWTSGDPRQDIPIMVFTLDQWRAVQHDQLSVTAAPIGPGELGRNRRYVFALPPRYNYAFLPGYKEVAQILKTRPLRPDCQTHRNKN
jgi:hypothetical protein